MVLITPHREVEKALRVVRLATHKLLMFVDAVVGVELLASILPTKQMATVLPNNVLVRRCPRLQTLVKDTTGMNFFSMLCFVPPL